MCRESDVDKLRQMCKQAIRERDAERAAKLQHERQVSRLQTDVDAVSKPLALASPIYVFVTFIQTWDLLRSDCILNEDFTSVPAT
jgi:hypothetical protein